MGWDGVGVDVDVSFVYKTLGSHLHLVAQQVSALVIQSLIECCFSIGFIIFTLYPINSAVKEVPMLHFGENEFLVNMKTLLIDLSFGKILGDLTPPQ